MNERMPITPGTVARTLILFLALLNHLLTVSGYNPIPFSEEGIEQFFAFGFDAVAAIIAWWKNNSFTFAARAGDMHKERLKKM